MNLERTSGITCERKDATIQITRARVRANAYRRSFASRLSIRRSSRRRVLPVLFQANAFQVAFAQFHQAGLHRPSNHH